jgi:hypothetical protein
MREVDMAFTARAFSPADAVPCNADVESVDYRDGALVVVLACAVGPDRTVHGLRVTFQDATGFRLLDESGLARYRMSDGFPRGSHVMEVTAGGWSAEEDALQGLEKKRREWLVASGNASVSVFCATEPTLTGTMWKVSAG